MLPGPTLVYECPCCGNLLTTITYMSGNTFGGKLYSDGKLDGSMLPEGTHITKCKKCGSIFWLRKAKQVGMYSTYKFAPMYRSGTKPDTVEEESPFWPKEDPAWRKADAAAPLSIDDCFRALEEGMAGDGTEELDIRLQIWWRYNDRIRVGKPIFESDTDEARWTDNAAKLITLFDQTNNRQRLMTAEVHRNLGNFEECIRLIESLENEKSLWLKDKFITECKSRNRWLFLLR